MKQAAYIKLGTPQECGVIALPLWQLLEFTPLRTENPLLG